MTDTSEPASIVISRNTVLEFGLSHRDFFERHFERTTKLWRNALSDVRPTWRDLDEILQRLEPDDKLLQMFLDGAIPSSEYASERHEMGRTRRVIDKQRFFSLLYRGATLVLNRLENRHTLTRHLCNEIGRFTGIPTSCNSYVTWAGPGAANDGAFGKHWDTHDVFVIQLIGRKHWRVFPPTLPLPLTQQTSKNSGMTCPSQVHLDCILAAGDMLYIPRGWWHEVTPLNTGSWHVSVGVYTPTVTDFLCWLCQQVVPALPEARRGAHVAPATDTLTALLQQVTRAAADPRSFLEFQRLNDERNQPHGELNTQLFMPDAGPWQDDAVRVARATPNETHIERGAVRTPLGDLPLDSLRHDLLAALNHVQDINLNDLIKHLGNHRADDVRNAVRQLAVMEVILLTTS